VRVSRQRREQIADWLTMLGGAGLLLSLFLAWSHQFSAAFLAQWGSSEQLQGIPRDPTAWQVYSTADVLLAVLGAGLIAVALRGHRNARMATAGVAVVALAFTVHALSVPPTNGANIDDPSATVPRYYPNAPVAATGETVAIASLVVALAGLGLSFTAD
jgi:hypothetical protein